MEFTATARFTRTSPRRTRLVANLIRGKNVLEALDILIGTPKAASDILARVVRSARANAIEMDKHKNLKINPDRFVIRELLVDGGPMLKRSRPMSMGKSGRIRKRTAHITVVLAEPVVRVRTSTSSTAARDTSTRRVERNS